MVEGVLVEVVEEYFEGVAAIAAAVGVDHIAVAAYMMVVSIAEIVRDPFENFQYTETAGMSDCMPVAHMDREVA